MRLAAIVLLAFLGMAQDQPAPKKSERFTVTASAIEIDRVSAFTLRDPNQNKLILKISPKGEITFGEGITPDQAAKAFAEYLRKYMPCAADAAKPQK